jgi:AcrR family transcriptional regulator
MTSPQPPRNARSRASTRVSKAELERQLLAAAKELFATQGYQAASTEQIAAAAGVTEPVLSRHFANKKALFLEILAEIRTATLHRWETETGEITDPLARLRAIADLYLAGARQHALEFRIVHRALVETQDEEILALLRGFYQESETLLAGIISEGQQSGVFRRSLDPRVGAWELIHTALGYTLTLSLGLPIAGEADHLPRAIECLLYCLRKTDV